MINRFDQFRPLDLSMVQYAPEAYVPDVGMLAKAQTALQEAYEGLDAPYKLPKYIRQSPLDVVELQDYKTQLQSRRAEAKDRFLQGDIPGAMQSMRNIERFVNESQQPGGQYYDLEQRYGEYLNMVNRIQDFYKDNPNAANYAVARIGFGDQFRNPLTGEVTSLSSPDTPRLIDDEEIHNYFLNHGDKIKETLLKSGFYKLKDLGKYTSVYDMLQEKGVTFNRVVSSLYDDIPDDFLRSMKFKAEMEGREFDPDPFIRNDRGDVVIDKNGQYQLNYNSPIGRIIGSMAGKFARTTQTHDLMRNQDDWKLWKDQKDYEKDSMYTTYVSSLSYDKEIPFAFKEGYPGKDFTKDSRVVREEYERWKGNWLKTHPGTDPKDAPTIDDYFSMEYISPDESFSQKAPEQFVYNALSGELDDKMPGFSSLAKSVEAELNGLVEQNKDMEAVKLLERLWKQAEDYRTQADVQFNIFDPRDKNAMQLQKTAQEIFVEKGKMRDHNYYYVMDAPGGKLRTGQLDWDELMDFVRKNTDLNKEAQLREHTNYSGTLASANNPVAPSGHVYQVSDNGKTPFYIIGAHETEQMSNKREAVHLALQTKWSASATESPIVKPDIRNPATGMSILQKYPEGFYTRKVFKTNKDKLTDNIARWTDQLMGTKDPAQRAALQGKIDQAQESINEINRNRDNLQLVPPEIEFYDGRYHPAINPDAGEVLLNEPDNFEEQLLQAVEQQ